MLRLAAILVFGTFAVGGPAQTVAVTGIVRPVTGPTVCQQGETHYLESAQVYLKSDSVDLNALVGQNVRLTGAEIGVTCRVIDVTAAVLANLSLESCGTPAPGCPLKFKVCPGPIGLGWLALSTGPGFLPLSLRFNSVPETVLLATPWIAIPLGFGMTGCFEETVPIPLDLSLVGASFWLQGVRMDIGPVGPLRLSNVIRLTIRPPSSCLLTPRC